MSSGLKNIISLLVVLVFAFLGYYMFIQDGELETDGSTSSVSDAVFANTQLFIERREILDGITIDTSIFENRLFLSYRTFSNPIQPRPIQRENPFEEFDRNMDNRLNTANF